MDIGAMTMMMSVGESTVWNPEFWFFCLLSYHHHFQSLFWPAYLFLAYMNTIFTGSYQTLSRSLLLFLLLYYHWYQIKSGGRFFSLSGTTGFASALLRPDSFFTTASVQNKYHHAMNNPASLPLRLSGWPLDSKSDTRQCKKHWAKPVI